jgi:hypothetical protein
MWDSILKTVAPILGAAIGGPFGGMASKFLINALGGDEDTTEDQMQKMIETASPETLLKLKTLDADFKTQMKVLGIKEKDLDVQDRASARAMGIQTTLLPQMIISTIFVATFALIMYTVFTATLDMTETQKAMTNILL